MVCLLFGISFLVLGGWIVSVSQCCAVTHDDITWCLAFYFVCNCHITCHGLDKELCVLNLCAIITLQCHRWNKPSNMTGVGLQNGDIVLASYCYCS